MDMHDQSVRRTSGRTLAAVSAMCVRALRIAVLKYAGNFPRCECLDLKAEKIRRVKYFIRAKGGICCCSQFSNTGAAGHVRKFQTMAQTTAHGPLDERAGAGFHAEIAFAESTWLRSRNFWIFPVDVFGMAPNTTAFGVLKPDMWLRQ
jgi:hypothetical protein